MLNRELLTPLKSFFSTHAYATLRGLISPRPFSKKSADAETRHSFPVLNPHVVCFRLLKDVQIDAFVKLMESQNAGHVIRDCDVVDEWRTSGRSLGKG